MVDYSRQLAFINHCNDPHSLRNLIARAKAENASIVEDAAFKRLVRLVPDEAPGTVEHDFWTTVNAFEEMLTQERGRTTRLARTRQKVKRAGVVQTLRDWAMGSKTAGFEMLIARRMPELTGEAIVLRHPKHFTPEALQAAQNKLIEALDQLHATHGLLSDEFSTL